MNAHVHPTLGAVINAHVQSRIDAHKAQVLAYQDLLKRHDWLFAYSDDSRAYNAGREQRKELEMIRREIDPDYQIWNEFCHAECKNGAKSC